jgi:nucleoside-diphosphate-sugar epimerase
MSAASDLHVVFGTGPVGLAVLDELVARGQRVRMVNRSGKAAVPAGVEVRAGDASDPASTRDLCRGAAVVYLCVNAPYDRWPQLFPPLQAGILEGAAAHGAKLVVMENLYMYGPTGGQPLTEDRPYAATFDKGIARAQMAQAVLDAHRSGKVRAVSARAADFFGPRALASAMGERVFANALAGKAAQVIGKLDVPHTYTYMPDIGKALVILGERDEALGQAWHIPSPQTVTTREFLTKVFQEVGRPPKIMTATKPLLWTMGLFTPMMRELLKTYYQFDAPFVVDHHRFAQTFGDVATPLDQAIHTTVEWYRARAAGG